MTNGGYLYIDDFVFDVINRFRQHALEAPESGGFLTGYYKGRDLHVINLTVPQRGDYSSRFRFSRRDPRHMKQVKQWYRESGCEINCLGEWHTHPEPSPTPSGIDSNSWRIFNKNRHGQKAVFLIAGTEGVWVGEYSR